MVIRLGTIAEEQLHKVSGAGGVSTGKYIETDMDRDFFSTIALAETGWEHAMEQAKFLGADAYGIVPTRHGWGVRVRSARYDALAKRLRPDDYQLITGKEFRVCPLGFAKKPSRNFSGLQQNFSKYAGRRRPVTKNKREEVFS